MTYSPGLRIRRRAAVQRTDTHFRPPGGPPDPRAPRDGRHLRAPERGTSRTYGRGHGPHAADTSLVAVAPTATDRQPDQVKAQLKREVDAVEQAGTADADRTGRLFAHRGGGGRIREYLISATRHRCVVHLTSYGPRKAVGNRPFGNSVLFRGFPLGSRRPALRSWTRPARSPSGGTACPQDEVDSLAGEFGEPLLGPPGRLRRAVETGRYTAAEDPPYAERERP